MRFGIVIDMEEVEKLEARDLEALEPGKSHVWVVVKQPLFETFTKHYSSGACTYLGHRYGDEAVLEGKSPMLYKPKELVYVGMFLARGTNDKIAVLTEPGNNDLRFQTWIVLFHNRLWVSSRDKPEISSDFIYSLYDHESYKIVDPDKVALDKDKCFELCRYFNVSRSGRYLDKGLDLTHCGKDYENLLKSMLKQLREAERAEYMVDPAEQIKKDLDGKS